MLRRRPPAQRPSSPPDSGWQRGSPLRTGSPRPAAGSTSGRVSRASPFLIRSAWLLPIMHCSQAADRLWAGELIEERPLIFRSPDPDVSIPEVPLTPFVLQRAGRLGDKAALIDGPTGRTLSFSQFAGAVRQVAGGLARRGFRKGDR